MSIYIFRSLWNNGSCCCFFIFTFNLSIILISFNKINIRMFLRNDNIYQTLFTINNKFSVIVFHKYHSTMYNLIHTNEIQLMWIMLISSVFMCVCTIFRLFYFIFFICIITSIIFLLFYFLSIYYINYISWWIWYVWFVMTCRVIYGVISSGNEEAIINIILVIIYRYIFNPLS